MENCNKIPGKLHNTENKTPPMQCSSERKATADLLIVLK